MAGHALTVLDERSRAVTGATVWMGGSEYTADERGEITLPFANAATRSKLVLCHEDFGWPTFLDHKAETYNLAASFCVQREATIRNNIAAQVVVRPVLSVAGVPTSLLLLKKIRLAIGECGQRK